MTNIWLIGILQLVILIIAIGLILRFLADQKQQQAQQETNNVPEYGIFSGCTTHLVVWLFIICTPLAIVGQKTIANSYYNYLTTELLLGGVAFVWFTALAIGGIFFPSIMGSFSEPKHGRIIMLLLPLTLTIFIVGYTALIAIPDSFATIKGLIDGPEFTDGIVQGKSSQVGRSASFYVDVNDQHYHVPNSIWWETVTNGQTIAYAFNPYTSFDSELFPHHEINFTIAGIVIIMTCILLWAMTIWTSIGGYYYTIKLPKNDSPTDEHSLNPTIAHQSAQIPPVDSNHYPKKSNLPLIGLGIGLFTTFLILIWKTVFKRRS